MNSSTPRLSRSSHAPGPSVSLVNCGQGGVCSPRSRWMRSRWRAMAPSRWDALGQPQYTAKCKTNSSMASRPMSPLARAAWTWSSMGCGESAAATHVSVTQRRSRRLSPERDQTSP